MTPSQVLVQRSVTVSSRDLNTRSNRSGRVEQNFYTGIGLFLSSQQRDLPAGVIGSLFFLTQPLRTLQKRNSSAQEASGRKKRQRGREEKYNFCYQSLQNTWMTHSCTLVGSFLNWADCFRVIVVYQWTDREKNVTTGPEVSERNERTVRATVFHVWLLGCVGASESKGNERKEGKEGQMYERVIGKWGKQNLNTVAQHLQYFLICHNKTELRSHAWIVSLLSHHLFMHE